MIERFQNAQNIDLATSILLSTAGAILTGLGDVTVRVRRESDGFWLDWFDNTFKAAAWTTLDGAMSEVDATRAAGVYARDFPTVGFADDRYYARMASPSAFNSPQEAAALVGEWVDNLDASVAAVQVDTDDIQARLPATLVSGRMRSHVEALDAGAITAAVIATNAIDADALAADAVSEIAAGVRDQAALSLAPAGSLGRAALRDLYQTRWGPAVTINTATGAAGVVLGVNGTVNNPSSNVADARTIADALGVRAYVIPAGTVTLAASHTDWSFYGIVGGNFGVLDPGGQDISASTIEALFVAGDFGALTSYVWCRDCFVGASTNFTGDLEHCQIDALTCLADVHMTDCTSFLTGPTNGANISPAAGGFLSLRTHRFSGLLRVDGVTNAASVIHVHAIEGEVRLGATNTAAAFFVWGGAEITSAIGGTATLDRSGAYPDLTDVTLTAVHGAGLWDATAVVSSQAIRDAMKLAPTVGAPAAGSVDEHLDDILAGAAVSEIQIQETWTALGLNTAAPASFDFPALFIQALANVTPIDITISVVGSTVILTRQP